MRAVVCERYGGPEVLALAEIPKPAPGDGEVLVRVHATTVNRNDCWFRCGKPLIGRLFSGLARPRRRVLGSELAGEVEAVGAGVAQFEVGDEVFGMSPKSLGANAEFICIRQDGPLARKPAAMTFEEAAAVCDGATLALACLRKVDLRQGQQILVYGASGSIGTAAVQLAKYFGASVTAVCNTKNVDIVRSLGADEVIDYTKDDFTVSAKAYDVVFDAVGKTSFRRCKNLLVRGGHFLATDRLENLVLNLWTAVVGDKRVLFPIIPRYDKADIVFLAGVIDAGRYQAVIDRRYPLDQVVDATTYVETKQKTGNVVLTVGRPEVAGSRGGGSAEGFQPGAGVKSRQG